MIPRPSLPTSGTVRKILTWTGAIVGSLAALLVLGALGAYFGLQTRVGGRLLKAVAVGQVNKIIKGHLAVGEVAFHGTSLDLRTVVLTDPDNVPVIRLGHLSVKYRLWDLLSRRVEIDSVDIVRPEIDLRQDGRGSNISRALASREPATVEPSKPASAPGKGWQVDLVRFGLREGRIQLVSAPTSPAAMLHEVRLGGLGILAAARVQTAKKDGEFHLELGGQVDAGTAISREPLAVSVHGAMTAGIPRGTASVNLGSLVALLATMTSDRNAELQLRKLRMPPALMLAFLPSWPVRVALELSGNVRLRGDIVSTAVSVRGEGVAGDLTITADGNLSGTYTPHGVQVRAQGLRLSDFVAGVPVTAPLAMSLSVSPGSLLLDEAVARANIDIPRTILRGQGFGPLKLAVAATRGTLEHLTLRLPLPGALLSAEGESRHDNTVVTIHLQANRLRSIRAAAIALGAGALPPLDGVASIEIAASGPARLYPVGKATSSQIARADARAGEINLLPAAITGWTLVTNLSAPRIKVGESRYRGIAVRVVAPALRADQQNIELTASLRAPVRIAVSLAAKVRETQLTQPSASGGDRAGGAKRTEVALERLAIDYPGARWATQTPAHLTIDSGQAREAPDSRVSLEGLALRAGTQTIAADAIRDNKSLSATLRIDALRIQDLPGIQYVGVKLAGLVNARVHAGGSPERPRIDAKVTLREGRADTYNGLTADLGVTVFENRTFSGRAEVGGGRLGTLTAQIKGPATTPPPQNAPIAVTVDARHVELGKLPIPPALRIKADGNVQAHLEVRGTIGDPRLTVRVVGRRMTIHRLPPPATMVAAGGNGGVGGPDATAPVPPFKVEEMVVESAYASPRLEVAVTVIDDQQGSVHLSGSSRISLAELRRPGGPVLASRGIAGSLRLEDVNPEAISAFVPALKVVRGKISAAFAVRGTVSEPQFGGEMRWRKGELVVIQAPHDGGPRTRQGRGPDSRSRASQRPEPQNGRLAPRGESEAATAKLDD